MMARSVDLFSRLTFWFLTILTIGLCVPQLYLQVRYYHLVEFAAQLSDGYAGGIKFFNDFSDTEQFESANFLCIPNLVNARVTFALAKIRAAVLEKKHDMQIGLQHQAQDLVRQQLQCSPADGAAWTRLALLEYYDCGLTDNVLHLLIQVYDLAPAESWIAAFRLPNYIWISNHEHISDLDAIIQADFKNVAINGPYTAVPEIYKSIPSLYQAQLMSLVEQQLYQRRKFIYWSFLMSGTPYPGKIPE